MPPPVHGSRPGRAPTDPWRRDGSALSARHRCGRRSSQQAELGLLGRVGRDEIIASIAAHESPQGIGVRSNGVGQRHAQRHRVEASSVGDDGHFTFPRRGQAWERMPAAS